MRHGAAGKDLSYANLPADAYRDVLVGAGFPPPVADIFVDAVTSAKREESRILERCLVASDYVS